MRCIVYIFNFWFSALGCSSCSWFATQVETCGVNGNATPVPCEKMPQTCSSFVWDSIMVDWGNDVFYAYDTKNEKGYLNFIRKIIVWPPSHNASVDTVIELSRWQRKTISTTLCPRRMSLKILWKLKNCSCFRLYTEN